MPQSDDDTRRMSRIAATFVTAADDPAKFAKSKTVGAYLGLSPRQYQSGETEVNGCISKCGDILVRRYPFEAATTLLLLRASDLP